MEKNSLLIRNSVCFKQLLKWLSCKFNVGWVFEVPSFVKELFNFNSNYSGQCLLLLGVSLSSAGVSCSQGAGGNHNPSPAVQHLTYKQFSFLLSDSGWLRFLRNQTHFWFANLLFISYGFPFAGGWWDIKDINLVSWIKENSEMGSSPSLS